MGYSVERCPRLAYTTPKAHTWAACQGSPGFKTRHERELHAFAESRSHHSCPARARVKHLAATAATYACAPEKRANSACSSDKQTPVSRVPLLMRSRSARARRTCTQRTSACAATPSPLDVPNMSYKHSTQWRPSSATRAMRAVEAASCRCRRTHLCCSESCRAATTQRKHVAFCAAAACLSCYVSDDDACGARQAREERNEEACREARAQREQRHGQGQGRGQGLQQRTI